MPKATSGLPPRPANLTIAVPSAWSCRAATLGQNFGVEHQCQLRHQSGVDTRSKIDASSFSGLFTRVEIGHIVIGSAG
jgi:hypothetical protein